MSKLNKNYLSITFLIMLIGWGICLLCSFNGISLNDNKWLYAPYLLGGWSPTIASYLSLRGNNKVADMKDWLKNIFDFRHNIFSYLMVVIMAVIFILPQCFISGYENGAPVFAIFVMIPMMLVGGGLEEAGWRYILQTELEKKYSFTLSTIKRFEAELHSEIEKIIITDEFPEKWTYPDIQPHLIKELKRRGHL